MPLGRDRKESSVLPACGEDSADEEEELEHIEALHLGVGEGHALGGLRLEPRLPGTLRGGGSVADTRWRVCSEVGR